MFTDLLPNSGNMHRSMGNFRNEAILLSVTRSIFEAKEVTEHCQGACCKT
jgi:hypothetical protein